MSGNPEDFTLPWSKVGNGIAALARIGVDEDNAAFG